MRELCPGIHTDHFFNGSCSYRIDGCPIGKRELHQVGKVIFSLRIVRRYPFEQFFHQAGIQRHDAGVDFADLSLRITRVGVFDNGADSAVLITKDSAELGGIVKDGGHQRQAASRRGFPGGFQRRRTHQRHVAEDHQRDGVILHVVERDFHRVTRTTLLRLDYPVDRGIGGGGDLIPAMAYDDVNAARCQALRGRQDMREHRPAADPVQHFGQLRSHAFASAGRQHDYFECGKSRRGGSVRHLCAIRCPLAGNTGL